MRGSSEPVMVPNPPEFTALFGLFKFLLSQYDQSGSNIIMVDHFRYLEVWQNDFVILPFRGRLLSVLERTLDPRRV